MTGHIKLGLTGSLRDYNLKAQGEGIAWRRGPANPFAGKVDTSDPYGEIDAWNEYIQQDWQTGVGRVDPDGGGFLYAEAETRVPKQVILPPLLQMTDTRVLNGTISDCRYMPTSVAGTITVGTGSFVRVAMAFTTPGTVPSGLIPFAFYARITAGVSATIAIYSNSAGSPNTLVTSATLTGDSPDRNFRWYAVNLTGLSTGTQYWLTIEPTSGSDSLEVAYGSSGYNTVAKSYNGSAWSAISSTYLLHMTGLHRLDAVGGVLDKGLIRFNSILYSYSGEGLWKLDTVNENFDTVGTITGAGNVTSVAVYGPTLFFARSSGNYTTMNTSEVFSAAATTATLFLEYDGLLYRSYQNDLYFSSDGSTWSSAYQVGGDDVEIRGMAGMGDSLYLATDKALYRFAPGNVVEEVTRFGAEETTNGVGMVEYQGRLYIPIGGRIFRFDPSGQLQDIWISRDDDLPATRIGRVHSMARMNNWLVALVVPTSSGAWPSLWMWQEEGWHFIANASQLGSAITTDTLSVYYDRGTSRLWITNSGMGPLYVDIDDYTLNPFNNSAYLYQPYGWLEQDRFYGGQFGLNKAFYSVRIYGDNLSSGIKVLVYWQDEDSTAWELLGTVDEDGEEVAWPAATRPLGKWVKLGLLLQTNDGDETPRIRAVVLKFLPIVNDRRQDTMTLTLSDSEQGPDGNPGSYTLAQQLDHLESMIGFDLDNSAFILRYQDPFGVQMDATIVQHSSIITQFAWENGAAVIKEAEVTLVIEQIPDAAG